MQDVSLSGRASKLSELRAGIRRITLKSAGSALHGPIAGAVLLIGALTFTAKVAVVFKDTVVASHFGTGDALDAFLIAFLLPSFAVNVIAGSLQSAFLPTYVHVRSREGAVAARVLLSHVLGISVTLLLAVTVLFAAAGGTLINLLGSGFSPEKLELTRVLFYMLLPTLFVTGISTLWATTLNAGERFAVVAFAPILTPAIVVAALLITGKTWGIYAIAAGTVLGVTAEAAVIGFFLSRSDTVVWPAFRNRPAAARDVTNQFVPMIAAAVMMSSTTFIDQSMAAALGSGSVSVLNYGSRVVTGLLGVSSIALGTAVFPHFAKRIAQRDRAGALAILRTYSVLIVVVSIPLVVGLIVGSEAIVRFLFERGSFTASDTRVVAGVQSFYVLQIPFYLVGLLGVRFISSMQGNRLLLWIAAVSLACNIGGNLLFMRFFGVAGIALSTSCVYVLSCAMIFVAVRHILITRDESNSARA